MGGLNTQGTIFQARMNVALGVWMRIEAKVPRNTMTNAAGFSSEPTPAPFRMAPTMMEKKASAKPPTVNASIRPMPPSGRRRPHGSWP